MTSISEARRMRLMYGSPRGRVRGRATRASPGSSTPTGRTGSWRWQGTRGTPRGEQHDEQDADDELRQRSQAQTDDRVGRVERSVAAIRGVGPDEDRERHADERRPRTSAAVFLRRKPRRLVTLVPCANDVPKLPTTAPLSHRAYCVVFGGRGPAARAARSAAPRGRLAEDGVSGVSGQRLRGREHHQRHHEERQQAEGDAAQDQLGEAHSGLRRSAALDHRATPC